MASRQDMFSERYCKELVKLRDNVAPLPFADVQRVIEEEYGCPMQEVFSSFERIPLGSASIAQVHKASLLDGREIVVKVQRPYIYEMMERDISLIRRAGKLLRLSEVLGSVIDINIVMDEFWFTAKQEMDFLNEARFAMEFARNHQSITYIGAPLIEQAYTTSRSWNTLTALSLTIAKHWRKAAMTFGKLPPSWQRTTSSRSWTTAFSTLTRILEIFAYGMERSSGLILA
jgi:ubiquinone biosynthesis protein